MNPAESEEAFCALRFADRRVFCEIALVEMTSVMRYYLAGHVSPWCDLSSDARRRHMVRDPAAYLATVGAPAWKAHLNKYGWQELSQPDTALHSEGIPASPAQQELLQECARGLQHSGMSWVTSFCGPSSISSLPEHPEHPEHEPTQTASAPPPATSCKQEPPENPQLRPCKGELISGTDMARLVLRGCLDSRPITRSQLSQSQVLRQAVELAHVHFGEQWPLYVGIAHDAALLDQQQQCPLLCILVYSEVHWAFLAVGRSQAIFFDGKKDPVTRDHARSFVQHLMDRGRLPTGTQILSAQVPQQQDGWSCGHRVIGYMDVIMCHAAQHPSVQDLPTAADLSSSNVLAARLIGHHGHPAAKPAARVKAEHAEPVAPTGMNNEDKRRIDSLGTDLPHLPAEGADAENAEPRTPKRRRREAEVQKAVDEPMTPPAGSPLVRRVPRRGAKALSVADGPEGKKPKKSKLDEEVLAAQERNPITHREFQKQHAAAHGALAFLSAVFCRREKDSHMPSVSRAHEEGKT